ncbi:MAG TPA: YdcF family protein [Gemmatimonadaceae bacterium]
MPRLNPARAKRVAGDLFAGAILGGLIFVTARALGLFMTVHWYEFEAFWPFVIGGAALFPTLLRPVLWTLAGLLMVAAAVVALTPAITRPALSLVRADSATTVDAVVVLSSGLSDDDFISSEALDRLLSGIALARDTSSSVDSAAAPLVLTVVTRGSNPRLSSVTDQRRILELTGGDLEVHWTEPVFSTRDEARAAAALARTKGWERVAVVTSPLHTRRACATFERVGLSVRCVPAQARDVAIGTLRTPRDRLRAAQLWVYETAGTLYYRLRRWL